MRWSACLGPQPSPAQDPNDSTNNAACRRRQGRCIVGPSHASDGLQQKEEPSPREFECHLMVAQSLTALDQTQVPDQAVVTAAHSTQSAVPESLHREMDAPLSDFVNS
jgi:hypothetical protein